LRASTMMVKGAIGGGHQDAVAGALEVMTVEGN
jgi:hypothetical protein